jgi:predicted CxxxxCH...CXXCH cytochrome family protein
MSKLIRGFWLPIILMTSLLTACGGGGGGGDSSTGGSTGSTATTTGITSGIAVDPYITNARFEELSADGQTLIQSSTGASSSTGQFSFSNEIADGSIIRINLTSKGQHANAPYAGVIKRKVVVGDTGPVVVSPLTTLLANGMSPAAVIQMLNSAGLSGLTEDDLDNDPMIALTNKTGTVTAADLVLLQANMAVNAFMVANQDFNYGGPATTAVTIVAFNDVASMVQDSLNPVIFQQMTTAIGTGFTVGDLANTAVVVTNTAVQQIQQQVDPVTAIDNALADATTIADSFYQTRTGGSTTDPGTGTGGGTTSPTGSELYASNCQLCHGALASSNISNRTATGIQSALDTIGSMSSISLTSSEVQLISDALTGTTTTPPATDPGTGTGGSTGGGTTTPTGSELYASNCQLCHGALASSNISNRTATGIQSALDTIGSMSSISLTSSEVQLISEALTASAPPTTDPGTGTGGSTPACGSCHSLPPSGTTFPNEAGSHAIHTSLNGIGTTCDNCHAGNDHQSGFVDLGFASTWNAKSGPATDNMDGTCSNISCHGGKQTPVWGLGSINVNTDCTSCHALGTAQYNSYNSGQHSRSAHVRQACTACHNTTSLATSHFQNLGTSAMEGPASATIGGGSTRINSYNTSTRTCTNACHGSETW